MAEVTVDEIEDDTADTASDIVDANDRNKTDPPDVAVS